MSNLKSRVDRLKAKTHTFFSYRSLRLIQRYHEANVKHTVRTNEYGYNYSKWMEVCNKIAENPILEYFELISAICEREPAVKWARSLEAAKETCKTNPKGLWVKNSEADLVGFYKSELTHAKKYFKLIPEFEWQ